MENSNYSALQETILLSIGENELIRYEGKTWKRDREMQRQNLVVTVTPREECEDFIIENLAASQTEWIPVADVDASAVEAGFSKTALRRSKEKLKENKIISMKKKKNSWCIKLIQIPSPCASPRGSSCSQNIDI